MPGRKFNNVNQYRYGFNGKEQDKETTGTSTYDYGFRVYSPGLGRFLSVDPLTDQMPSWSPYTAMFDNPIRLIDPDGRAPGDLPAMNLDSRHLLSERNFTPKDVNSIVVNPEWQNRKSVLQKFYNEAVGLVKQMGKIEKDVTLSNGSVWNVNVKTGHFYPVSSTDGSIVNLSKAEMGILQGATKNGAKGEAIFKNLAAGLKGRGIAPGSLSQNMEIALSSLAKTEGISTANSLGKIGSFLPSTPVSSEATAAAAARFGNAFKYVKWGGRALIIVAVAADIYEVYNSNNKARTITTKVGSWSGASAGASGGAAIGAWAAGWGAIPGAIIGGIGGYFAGEKVTEVVYDWIFTPAK